MNRRNAQAFAAAVALTAATGTVSAAAIAGRNVLGFGPHSSGKVQPTAEAVVDDTIAPETTSVPTTVAQDPVVVTQIAYDDRYITIRRGAGGADVASTPSLSGSPSTNAPAPTAAPSSAAPGSTAAAPGTAAPTAPAAPSSPATTAKAPTTVKANPPATTAKSTSTTKATSKATTTTRRSEKDDDHGDDDD